MAEYPIEITESDVLQADTYLPLAVKEIITRNMATLLMEPVQVRTSDGGILPTMVRENRKLRQQFQMGVLATKLKREFTEQNVRLTTKDGEVIEQPLAWVMDEDDYEKWAQSHVMNQLERMKKSRDTKVVNKLFDLLYDYRSIEYMLSGAIRDELDEGNDIFNRAMEYFSVSAVDAGMKELAAQAMSELRKEGEAESDG